MTVIWSNDGAGLNTVTTVSSDDYTPPQAIVSKMIAPDGGSFMYNFNKPGVYKYADLMNSKASGIVDVGSMFQRGDNFEMFVGGLDSLPSSSAHGLTVRFVPTTLNIPPTAAITYQVTMANSSSKLFSYSFDDTDGILDLELVPQAAAATSTNTANQFVTWGPDFAGQEGFGSTGTFHVQGPFTSGDNPYSITVTALSTDNNLLDNISDTFSINLQSN